MRNTKYEHILIIQGKITKKIFEFNDEDINSWRNDFISKVTGKIWGEEIHHIEYNEHVREFIGFKDINGLDIFDNDLVSIGSDELFIVKYSDERASYIMEGVDTGKIRLFETNLEFCSDDYRIDVNTIIKKGNQIEGINNSK